MAKKLIRLTESDLHRIVKESVRKIIREMEGGDGANNAAGVYGGAEGQAKNHIVAPAFKTDDDDDFFGDTLNHKNMCGFERV